MLQASREKQIAQRLPFRYLRSKPDVDHKLMGKNSTKWSVDDSFDYQTIENDLISFKQSIRGVSRYYKPVDLNSFKEVYRVNFNSIDFDVAFNSIMLKLNEEMKKKKISNRFKEYYVELEKYLDSRDEERIHRPFTNQDYLNDRTFFNVNKGKCEKLLSSSSSFIERFYGTIVIESLLEIFVKIVKEKTSRTFDIRL
ncbi:hypothetical protein GEMRC1_012232 [Eukaryota sp. GEM-RC1]